MTLNAKLVSKDGPTTSPALAQMQEYGTTAVDRLIFDGFIGARFARGQDFSYTVERIGPEEFARDVYAREMKKLRELPAGNLDTRRGVHKLMRSEKFGQRSFGVAQRGKPAFGLKSGLGAKLASRAQPVFGAQPVNAAPENVREAIERAFQPGGQPQPQPQPQAPGSQFGPNAKSPAFGNKLELSRQRAFRTSRNVKGVLDLVLGF